MAVTEAGCDLTYCKMRGIVAVLTGEQLKQYNTLSSDALVYWKRELNQRDYAYLMLCCFVRQQPCYVFLFRFFFF